MLKKHKDAEVGENEIDELCDDTARLLNGSLDMYRKINVTLPSNDQVKEAREAVRAFFLLVRESPMMR